MTILRTALRIVARLLIGAFFGFVGGMKGLAPMTELAVHHAWVVFIPTPLARLVGWSEVACAVVLLAALVRRMDRAVIAAAVVLIANQIVAAAVHLTHGEASALQQNALLVALLAFIWWDASAARVPAKPSPGRKPS